VTVLLGLIVFAPWLAGTWTATGIRLCELVAGGLFGVWLLGICATRRAPRVPAVLAMCVVTLLAQGWWMARSPQAGVGFPSWARAVIAVAPQVSREEMLRVSSVLAVLLVVSDVGRFAAVRTALWIGSAVAGCSVAVLGIAQRFGWFANSLSGMRGDEGTPFGTFNYHGNAGAFLNLVIPAVFGLAVVAWRMRKHAALRGLSVIAPLLLLVAAVVNVSRGAVAITALMLVTSAAVVSRSRGGGLSFWRAMLPLALVVPLALCVSHFANGGTSLHRWRQMVRQPTGEVARRMVWDIAWPMAAEAGPFGNGPGTFKVLLPKSPRLGPSFYEKWILQAHEPGGRISMWSQAHEDYLQTVVEWGWAGGAVWAAIFGGGFICLVQSARKRRVPEQGLAREGCEDSANQCGSVFDRTAIFCTGMALAGVCIHASFDFPLQILPLQFHVAMLLGLAWSSPRWEQSVPGNLPPPAPAGNADDVASAPAEADPQKSDPEGAG